MRKLALAFGAWGSVSILFSGVADAAGITTLNSSCRRGATASYACGECEGSLQDSFNTILGNNIDGGLTSGPWSSATTTASPARPRSGATVESFLSEVATMMRGQNNGELNYLLMGDSRSTQGTTPGSPRVMLKSPNGELFVTFNTNPASPGYNKVEIQRWDGRQGRFLYQELDFTPASPHADLSGSNCVSCHRAPSSRPNWDSYRAWAGVLPPRDDYLETDPPPGSDGSHGRRLAPSTRAYFNFMDRIVAARSNGTTDRLDILGLPGETAADRTALAAATTDAARRRILQQREDATRTAVTTNGYFRVPHIPNKDSGQLLNTSSKTSDGAGASHLMFDQLQGMNMCRITTEMSHNPNFNRFKYALAGITMCDSSPGSSSPTASRLREYIPDWVPGYARDFYTANSATALAQPGGAASVTGLTATSTPDQINDAVYDTVLQHTRRNHNRLDQDKQTRAEDFARSYLTWDNPAGASHMTTAQINAAARREARTAYNATNQENGLNLSAIDDPGGVQGVPEQDPAPITALRYITEPFGINAGNWSMTLGRNTADTTYAFSDQFVDMLKEQPVVTDTYNSPEVQAYITQHGGDNCSALKALSLQAFGTSPPQPPGSSGSGAGGGYEGLCRILRGDPGASGDIDGQGTTLAQITARQLQPIAERLMQRCGSCHGPGSANGEFVGMNPPDYNRLRTFLNSSAGGGRTWLQNIQDRLGSTPSGSQMPAGGGFNIDPASTDPTEHRRREEERRHAISGYLQAVANSPAGQPFP